MTQLTIRQQNIIDFIASKDHVQNQEVFDFLISKNDILSRKTLVRELGELVVSGHIQRIGKGRGIAYLVPPSHSLLKAFDHETYLAKDQDIRSSGLISFNHEIAERLQGLFTPGEIAELENKGATFRERVTHLSPTIIKKEFERITIELAWKSSKIEGNTYSLMETETLIKDHKEAAGHRKEEAVMILNHKKALDYIAEHKDRFKTISLRDIEDVHRLLVGDLDVKPGLRSNPVGITGTNYRPLDNVHQIREVMEKVSREINAAGDPWSKSLIALLMIAYIQPFEDGNKRTSRLMANACLIAHDLCPLSFRSVEVDAYKKAITLFYELGNASLMKKIFLEQFHFSLDNYFL